MHCSRLSHLNNYYGQSIHAGEGGHDLIKGREFCHHVQKECSQSQEAQINCHGHAISLAYPLCQDKPVWGFLPDDGTKVGKNQKG